MSIDAHGRSLWQKIPPVCRAAFFTCLISGYLTHLFAFSNLIPNSDGLSRMFDPQQMTVSGRWFLHYASALNEFTQMPAAIGLLALFLLALAAALTVDLLGFRSRVLAGAAGGLMAVFPCVGYTFLYMFTASAYALSIFLAVLSVWLVRKGRAGWLTGVLALALAMGIYQAYASFAITLCLLVVFRQTLEPKQTFRDTVRLGLRLMGYLAAGAVLYYGILLIFLRVKNLELLSYLGMDAASSGYPFAQLPRLILDAYLQVASFFFRPGAPNGFANGWMVLLDILALLLGLRFLWLRLVKSGLWKERWRPFGAAAMVALLPLGMNFMQLLSPWSAPTPLMKYSFVGVYLLVLLAADLADGAEGLPAAVKHLAPAVLLWCLMLGIFCVNTNNLLYTASVQAHRATESYATRLLTRIEACPGYEPGMDVAIVGAIPTDQLQSHIPSFLRVDHYSVPINSVLPLNKHIYYYLSSWLNAPLDELDEKTMISISNSPDFQTMPLYPAQGSVQVLDGRVVVRMAEEYTPKSDYELAYENRR